MTRHLPISILLFSGLSGPFAGASALAQQVTWQQYMQSGDSLMKDGNAKGAIEAYSNAIRLKLDNPDAWMARGRALSADGRYRDAIDDFDQAIRLRPGSTETLFQRGYAYGQAGDFERAIDDLRRVLRLDPNNVKALTLRGSAHAHLRHHHAAIEDYTKAAALAPNDPEIYLARALVFVDLGDHQNALNDRNTAVSLNPQSAEALLARGGSYHALGMHEQGLADRTEAIRLRPDMPEAWFARGSAYFLLGDYGRAESDFQEALRLRPEYGEARTLLARAEQQIAASKVPPQSENRPENQAANAALEPHESKETASDQSATHDRESNADISSGLAKISPAGGEGTPEQIVATANESRGVPVSNEARPKVISSLRAVPQKSAPEATKATVQQPVILPRNPQRNSANRISAAEHNRKGRELIHQQRYAEAIGELTAAIEGQPDFALAFNARGLVYLMQRQYPQALADFNQAIRIDPKYVNAYHNRSVARKASGDATGAAEDEAKVRELAKK